MFSLPVGRRRHWAVHRSAAVLVVVIALIVAGCSSADDEATAAGTDVTTVETSAATTPPAEIEAEPEPSGDVLPPATFEGQATTVSGETFELSTLAGQDLILWFWAPW